MLEKDLDIIYNKPYLVIVSQSETNTLIEALAFSLGNLITINNDVKEQNKVIEFIRQNNFPKLIFVGYQQAYDRIIYQAKPNMIFGCKKAIFGLILL